MDVHKLLGESVMIQDACWAERCAVMVETNDVYDALDVVVVKVRVHEAGTRRLGLV